MQNHQSNVAQICHRKVGIKLNSLSYEISFCSVLDSTYYDLKNNIPHIQIPSVLFTT